MVLRRGGRSVLSYSWIDRRGRFLAEWFRHAAALDRSPLVRPAHMLAIRISTPIESGAASEVMAEHRIREAWNRLAPQLVGYASIP